MIVSIDRHPLPYQYQRKLRWRFPGRQDGAGEDLEDDAHVTRSSAYGQKRGRLSGIAGATRHGREPLSCP